MMESYSSFLQRTDMIQILAKSVPDENAFPVIVNWIVNNIGPSKAFSESGIMSFWGDDRKYRIEYTMSPVTFLPMMNFHCDLNDEHYEQLRQIAIICIGDIEFIYVPRYPLNARAKKRFAENRSYF